MNCKVCSNKLNRGKFYCSHKCANRDMNSGKKRDKVIVEKARETLLARTDISRAKYRGVHKFMRRRVQMPDLCSNCRTIPPRDLANISGEYKQVVNDWVWLCRRCHQVKDGRMQDLKLGVKHLSTIKGKTYAKMDVTQFQEEINK